MLRLGKEVKIFDGGMGSEFERLGLDGNPMEYNITHAKEVQAIHRAYACADYITANSFGLNRIKYKGAYGLRELAMRAIENARVAGKEVFFDIGPTGAMLAPMGTLSFDEAYDAFAEIAEMTCELVDGYIAETFSDLYELKACVLALREHSNKPIFATMTFDASQRTLTGSTPEIAAAVLEGLGVDALGVNCSLGPKELLPVVERLLAATDLPIIVQPNCGLPVLENGKTRYTLPLEEFDAYARKFAEMGVSVLGGCCGTTPAFIERIAAYRGMPVVRQNRERTTMLCSSVRSVEIDGVRICGERLNPTGKPKLKEAILAGDYDYMVDEAVRQQEAGADILDLNVGLPKTDEAVTMAQAVRKIQEYVDLPLSIDSSSAQAIEKGVRYYNGIPLINSVNGEQEVMDRVFPIARKYGAVVLGLTMDGNGVPKTAEDRLAIAERIIAGAARYGIPRHKVMIDTLVLTASAEQQLVAETVKALALVRGLGVKTALGVSNVSFGLPNRPLLNRTFLATAMASGLNMPIMNPSDGEMVGTVKAYGVLSGMDAGAETYISLYRDTVAANPVSVAPAASGEREKAEGLYDCVRKGRKDQAEGFAREELKTRAPLEVVNDVLVRALTEVGDAYEQGKTFLPQLISAAEAAKVAFAVVSEFLPKGKTSKGKVVLATVKGDVHDIGKNIVKVVLESYGFTVIDLGKDTPSQKIVEACLAHKPLAVGLSALMTTTVASMEETVSALKQAGCKTPVFVGGAVLTADLAKQIGADRYTRDALEFVKVLQADYCK